MSEVSTELTLPQDEDAEATDSNAETKLSPFSTLTGVIVRPRATFLKLREAQRGYWWFVFILAVVATIVYAVAISAPQARMVQSFVPPEGMEGAEMPANLAQTTNIITTVFTVVGGVFSTLIGYLFLTLVVFGTGLMLGGKATFKQVFTISVWTTLPYVIRSLVQAIASLVTGAIPTPGLSGMLTLAESMSMPMLNAILSRIDVYMVWSLVLLVIGVSVLYRLSRGKVFIIVAAYVVLSLGLILAGSALSSGVQNLFTGGGGTGGGGGGPGGGGPRL
jgi:hypothetical protein